MQPNYLPRLVLWQLRRRFLASKLRRQGATAYEIISALRKHAEQHPHPVG